MNIQADRQTDTHNHTFGFLAPCGSILDAALLFGKSDTIAPTQTNIHSNMRTNTWYEETHISGSVDSSMRTH